MRLLRGFTTLRRRRSSEPFRARKASRGAFSGCLLWADARGFNSAGSCAPAPYKRQHPLWTSTLRGVQNVSCKRAGVVERVQP